MPAGNIAARRIRPDELTIADRTMRPSPRNTLNRRIEYLRHEVADCVKERHSGDHGIASGVPASRSRPSGQSDDPSAPDVRGQSGGATVPRAGNGGSGQAEESA